MQNSCNRNYGYVRKIIFPNNYNGNLSIGPQEYATSILSYCSGLQEVILPKTYDKPLPNGLFEGCGNLKKIQWPDNITSIPDYCFSSSQIENSYIIPDTVISIGQNAFYNASAMKKIHIPANVQSIGENAFAECRAMTDIYFDGSRTDVTVGQNSFNTLNISAKTNINFTTDELKQTYQGYVDNDTSGWGQASILKSDMSNSRDYSSTLGVAIDDPVDPSTVPASIEISTKEYKTKEISGNFQLKSIVKNSDGSSEGVDQEVTWAISNNISEIKLSSDGLLTWDNLNANQTYSFTVTATSKSEESVSQSSSFNLSINNDDGNNESNDNLWSKFMWLWIILIVVAVITIIGTSVGIAVGKKKRKFKNLDKDLDKLTK